LRTAVIFCDRDIVERRDRPVALYLLAHAQLELAQYGEAAASFAQAINLLKSGGALSTRLIAVYTGYGHALSAAERFEEAVSACREALLLDPPSGEQRQNLLANLAYVLSRLGNV